MTKRQFKPEAKYQILEEARQPGASVAEVCRRHQIASSLFYKWESEARQGALAALFIGPLKMVSCWAIAGAAIRQAITIISADLIVISFYSLFKKRQTYLNKIYDEFYDICQLKLQRKVLFSTYFAGFNLRLEPGLLSTPDACRPGTRLRLSASYRVRLFHK